jgi:hypothetical protein
MKKAVTHACPEDMRFLTMCRRDPEPRDGVSCYADDWTCPACLRLLRLLERVSAAIGALRRPGDGLEVVAAVAVRRAPELLDEGQARRVLAVLALLAGAETGR